MKIGKTPKRRGLRFKSVYARFAVIFLGIWWVFNSATFWILISAASSGDSANITRITELVFINNAVLGTVVILVALRGVVKPIKRLSSASREVAKGRFDIAVDIKNQDEIGRLAADFNMMVREIDGIDRMRREFVSNVSHEFRTPITSIRGFAKLIAENSGDSEAVREYGETIIGESDRLIGLSSNLLRLSELDTKTIHAETEFSLDEQLRQVVLALQPHWEPKNIEFDIELAEIRYIGDEDLLRQVWLNLIQNAIKFSHDGGTVKLELRKSGGSVRVIVSDDGVGISKEDLPRIFDRFYKGGASSGNGLGLSIVQKIMVFLGGAVWAESEVGKGTAFTVSLPQCRACP